MESASRTFFQSSPVRWARRPAVPASLWPCRAPAAARSRASSGRRAPGTRWPARRRRAAAAPKGSPAPPVISRARSVRFALEASESLARRSSTSLRASASRRSSSSRRASSARKLCVHEAGQLEDGPDRAPRAGARPSSAAGRWAEAWQSGRARAAGPTARARACPPGPGRPSSACCSAGRSTSGGSSASKPGRTPVTASPGGPERTRARSEPSFRVSGSPPMRTAGAGWLRWGPGAPAGCRIAPRA